MADRSFLSWPFLESRHQELHDRVEAWAVANVARLSSDSETSASATIISFPHRLMADTSVGLNASATLNERAR